MSFVEIEKEENVAVLYWNHEDQNRFTTPFCREFITALEQVQKDDRISGVVITGRQEKFFCTGLHLEWVLDKDAYSLERTHEFLETILEMNIKIATFPKPLVAAINGHAVAMGCIAAALMDFRFMREDHGFVCLPEVQIGIPFFPGMVAMFQQILSGKSFRDMAYTGRRFTAVEAEKLGYIDKVTSAEELVSMAVQQARELGTAKTNNYETIKLLNRKPAIDVMKREDPLQIERLCEILGRSEPV